MDERSARFIRVPTGSRRVMLILVLVAAVALSSCGGTDLTIDLSTNVDGKKPPAAQLASATADDLGAIIAGFRGRPVLVNVWASWCVPCRAEAPLLGRTARNADIDVIGIHTGSSRAEASAFIDEFGLDYPNLQDSGASSIQHALHVTAMPTTFVFDADGVLRGRTDGGLTQARLDAMVAEVIDR